MIYFCIKLILFNYITLLYTVEIVEYEEISDGLEQTTFVTFFLFNHDCSQTVISHIRQLYKIEQLNKFPTNKKINKLGNPSQFSCL